MAKQRKPKFNARLLLRVLHHIAEEPRRLQQNVWCMKSAEAPCGTVACVAGWAVFLTTPRRKWESFLPDNYRLNDSKYYSIQRLARERLGLTRREAKRLFDVASGLVEQQLAEVTNRISKLLLKHGVK